MKALFLDMWNFRQNNEEYLLNICILIDTFFNDFEEILLPELGKHGFMILLCVKVFRMLMFSICTLETCARRKDRIDC